ncbi:hypothetical protein FRB90_006754, partial [Tulasnella sp. 427]
IITPIKDASQFKDRYLKGSAWKSVHILPDEEYNRTHIFSYFIAFCKHKEALNLAYDCLHLQNVTVRKGVNLQSFAALAPTIDSLSKSQGAGTRYSSISAYNSSSTSTATPETFEGFTKEQVLNRWSREIKTYPDLSDAVQGAETSSSIIALPPTWRIPKEYTHSSESIEAHYHQKSDSADAAAAKSNHELRNLDQLQE